MMWILLLFLVVAMFVVLLNAARRYERESASAARREVKVLRAEVDRLAQRVQTLEVIASDEKQALSSSPPKAPRSVSSR